MAFNELATDLEMTFIRLLKFILLSISIPISLSEQRDSIFSFPILTASLTCIECCPTAATEPPVSADALPLAPFVPTTTVTTTVATSAFTATALRQDPILRQQVNDTLNNYPITTTTAIPQHTQSLSRHQCVTITSPQVSLTEWQRRLVYLKDLMHLSTECQWRFALDFHAACLQEIESGRLGD